MPKIILQAILLFIITLVWASPLRALTLNSTALGVPDGLSQSNVTSIVEDQDGYIWIGTVNGLNRYDGKDFKHYFPSADNQLPSAFIRSLFISDSGTMYIGTDKGLAVYDKIKDKVISSSSLGAKIDKAIWSISQSNNHLYLGSENSITVVDERAISSSLPKLKIKELISGEFGAAKQIIEVKNNLFIRNYAGTVINLSNISTPITQSATSMYRTKDQLYIFSLDGVFTLKGEKLERVSKNIYESTSYQGKSIIALSQNELFDVSSINSPILLGSFEGNLTDIESPLVIKGITKDFIINQNIGLIIIDKSSNIIKTKKLTTKNVWSIEKHKNSLLVATDDPIIKAYSTDLKLLGSFNSKSQGPKSAILIGNSIYVAGASGFISIDTTTGIIETLDPEPSFIVKSSTDKTKVIVGTNSGSIINFQIRTKLKEKFIIDQGNPIFEIKTYRDTIFIATQGGLFRFSSNEVTSVFSGQLVISLEISGNKVYFGTGTGLNTLNVDTGKIESIYKNNKPIFSISKNASNIIASSVSELIITNSKKTFVVNTDLGVQEEYNVHAILSKDNKTYVGGFFGITIIPIDKLMEYLLDNTPPKVTLSELKIFNISENVDQGILKSQLSKTAEIQLKYSDYPFTIYFNSPGSTFNNIDYVYQMQGLSESLIHSKGTNSATYTNLSPGEYNFSIYAIDPITGKQGETTELKIEITPPWWLSNSAKSVYFLCALFISIMIVRTILRRREIQKQIAKSEERLKLSLWGSGDEMWDWDIETGQIYRSNIWGSLEFPQDGQRSGNESGESNIHPMDQERVREALNKHFYGETDHFEAAYRVKGKAEGWVWILDRAKIVERDEHDHALRMTGTIKNITNFKQTEEQLKLFERAIQNISEGMFILDNEFKFVEVNEACCDQIMLNKEEFTGTLFNFDLYPNSYSEQIRSILKQQGRWNNEVEALKGNGTSFLMELSIDAIYDEQGELSHYVGVFSDISRRKQQEEELRKLTNNDLLTNLPNRSNLMVTLGNLVKRDSHHTLMVLDLDNFKKINDSLGHQVGDDLLIQVAKRIEAAVPGHTSIYRLGGDEFAILIDKNPDIGTSAVIAKTVIHAFEVPFELINEKVVVGVSIGIVLYPEDDQNEQALLRKADIAMYHAKSAGGNRYQFYSESLNKNAIRQLEVENLIREGLRDDLFEVYYQPKIDLKSGQMAGMEALVRLNHPEHGLIPPNKFIPLAEENGLIVEIGDHVLKKACFAAQKWRSQGLFNGRVAVNLSSKQFALPDLQQRIESILRLTQLPAANLELEITEGTVIREPEKAIKVMQQLAKMGVSLALDDFGTGYSSLSYLKQFPIHTLKIDKAFVDDIDKSDRDLKMVDSIITIAHNMGLSVVGEGVEETSQLNILKALKCEEIQGYIYSKAVKESEFTKLLRLDANNQYLPPTDGTRN
ncbi:EAL domain-containing protein [Shewanella sp. 1CM18E]|uniref:EAL domain-containing protein n=1 Tax=Shewanella sp. 1CM18E TaxID=2929169 RepID=UPI0020BF875E|nr:EAL domain-containing protein [Shewanella sp. 1CM18E]MCK8044046.1 EAL domain-containing protein [Shewanella sp. 1CM18E]